MPELPPLSYASIERSLREEMERQESLTKEFARHVEALSAAEAEFKFQFASERLHARMAGEHEGKKMTADMADDLATINSDSERRAMEKAKARLDATRQSLSTTRSQIDSLRSLMATYREAGI